MPRRPPPDTLMLYWPKVADVAVAFNYTHGRYGCMAANDNEGSAFVLRLQEGEKVKDEGVVPASLHGAVRHLIHKHRAYAALMSMEWDAAANSSGTAEQRGAVWALRDDVVKLVLFLTVVVRRVVVEINYAVKHLTAGSSWAPGQPLPPGELGRSVTLERFLRQEWCLSGHHGTATASGLDLGLEVYGLNWLSHPDPIVKLAFGSEPLTDGFAVDPVEVLARFKRDLGEEKYGVRLWKGGMRGAIRPEDQGAGTEEHHVGQGTVARKKGAQLRRVSFAQGTNQEHHGEREPTNPAHKEIETAPAAPPRELRVPAPSPAPTLGCTPGGDQQHNGNSEEGSFDDNIHGDSDIEGNVRLDGREDVIADHALGSLGLTPASVQATTARRGSGRPPGARNRPVHAIVSREELARPRQTRKGHGLHTNIHLAEDLGLAVDSEISDASFDTSSVQLFATIGGEEPAAAPKVSKPRKTAPAPTRQRKPRPMAPPKAKGGKATGPGAKAATTAPGGTPHAQSEAHSSESSLASQVPARVMTRSLSRTATPSASQLSLPATTVANSEPARSRSPTAPRTAATHQEPSRGNPGQSSRAPQPDAVKKIVRELWRWYETVEPSEEVASGYAMEAKEMGTVLKHEGAEDYRALRRGSSESWRGVMAWVRSVGKMAVDAIKDDDELQRRFAGYWVRLYKALDQQS
ncbi:hypothetical protein BOTBODRAFT_626053 [Botryobasidium botryosum FD-172 SS1]|uniref:Uncharacterized protein n=1 Tax=Botryobasidium botryosum (strain FD-172 SS1) TaxID=930990 RepID=A0A067M276_BOTB1|nr:hypothetical protein BOTBODRAFT_626053 [Botryobasidium botryosum FD-172 SS1]